MKKKVETSKKLAWLSGSCFVVTLLCSLAAFIYSILYDLMLDSTLLVTVMTVTGAVFGVTMVAYNNKSRYENVTKIQQNYLREKYTILKEIGALDKERAVLELEEEFADMENNADNERSMANQEITYNG